MSPARSKNSTGKTVIPDDDLFDLIKLLGKAIQILYRILESKTPHRSGRAVRAIITPVQVRSK